MYERHSQKTLAIIARKKQSENARATHIRKLDVQNKYTKNRHPCPSERVIFEGLFFLIGLKPVVFYLLWKR